ncbi:hypothetical protein C1632_04005 [Microbacterium testaceum]|uniref:exosortase S n=1 Tax=Microbacterium testaceum TaxID=2033 RepID=UPI000CCF7A31|nr:exosortase S [Microbacterium testaceum]PNW09592.1 hypothetical protein C1632_04005 [Microbacterium testaceum]
MSTTSLGRFGASFMTTRAALALPLLLAAVLLVANETRVRTTEAALTRWALDPITPGRAAAAGPVVYFGIGTPELVGLDITTLCSTMVLVVPLLVLAAAAVVITRARIGRVLVGLTAAASLASTCNIVRFVSAAWAYTQYGREGFDLVHRYIGSVFVLLGFGAAIALLLIIALRQPRAYTATPITPSPAVLRRDLRARRSRKVRR